jgi:hypothetical protein
MLAVYNMKFDLLIYDSKNHVQCYSMQCVGLLKHNTGIHEGSIWFP